MSLNTSTPSEIPTYNPNDPRTYLSAALAALNQPSVLNVRGVAFGDIAQAKAWIGQAFALIQPKEANKGECINLNDLAFPIALTQQGKDRFTVAYGKQIDRELAYGNAAAKLGQAIMHALACDGKLDNREKGER